MLININKHNEDKIFSCLLAVVIFFIFLSNLLANFLNVENIDLYLKASLALMIMIVSPLILKNIKYRQFSMIYISVFTIICNILFFPENNTFFYKTAITFSSMCLTSMVLISIIKDIGILHKYIYNISVLVSLICLIVDGMILIKAFPIQINNGYSMGLGYSCLIPVMILISDFLISKKYISFIMILSILFLVLSFGSRGPLISILFYLFLSLKNRIKNKVKFVLYFAILVLVLSIFYIDILTLVEKILFEFNIHSRTLSLLINDVNHTSGREYLYYKLINEITYNPLIIRGINADYVLLGIYAHNIIVELFFEFGLLFGTFLIILLIYCVSNDVLNKENKKFNINILLLSASVVPLCFSSSLWINNAFWMWIGLRLNSNYKNSSN